MEQTETELVEKMEKEELNDDSYLEATYFEVEELDEREPGRKEWTKSEIEDFIHFYKSLPCLWNVRLKDYRTRSKKQEALRLLCSQFNTDRHEIVRKIHNIRNQYHAERKKTAKIGKPSGWPYYKMLTFLNNVIQSRFPAELADGIEMSENSMIKMEAFPEINEDASQEYVTVSPIQTQSKQKRQTSKRKRSTKTNDIDIYNDNDNDNDIESSTPPSPSSVLSKLQTEINEEYDIFGKYVANEVRNLKTASNRNKLKRLIQKAILDVSEEDAHNE